MTAVVAVIALASISAQAKELDIAFDADLAFEFDRSHYEQLLSQTVNQGYDAAVGFVGVAREHPLHVAVYTPEHYAKVFGEAAQQRQGARYAHDAIYVNGGSRLDSRFAGEIAHEMTHAVLDSRGSGYRLPTWFNEGLAERVAWSQKGLDGLGASQVQEVKSAQEHGTLTELTGRGPLTTFGYLQSYAAILCLESKIGRAGVLRIAKKTIEGATFESALRGETHGSLADFERAFDDWAQRLTG